MLTEMKVTLEQHKIGFESDVTSLQSGLMSIKQFNENVEYRIKKIKNIMEDTAGDVVSGLNNPVEGSEYVISK